MNLASFLKNAKIRLDEIGFLSVVTDGLGKDHWTIAVVTYNMIDTSPKALMVLGGQPGLVSHITGLTPEAHSVGARGPHPAFLALQAAVEPYKYILSYSVANFGWPKLLHTWPAAMSVPVLANMDDIMDHVRMRNAESNVKTDVYSCKTVDEMRQKLVVEARKLPKPGALDAVHSVTGLQVPAVLPYLQKCHQLRNIFSWLMATGV